MLLVIAIILLIFLPQPWSFIVFAALLAGFVGEVVFWQRRLRHRRVEVGTQTLIGKTGQLASDCRPDGQVRIAGEIWGAHCQAGADEGATVRVQAVNDLTLVVEPEP